MKDKEIRERFGAVWEDINKLRDESKVYVLASDTIKTFISAGYDSDTLRTPYPERYCDVITINAALNAILQHLGIAFDIERSIPQKTVIKKKEVKHG